MIEISSLKFWAIAAIVVVLVRVLALRPSLRQLVFLGATIAVLTPLASQPLAALVFCAYVFYAYVAIGIGLGRWAMIVHATVLSAGFVALQYLTYLLWSGETSALPLIGIPYVFLRSLHLMFDIRAKTIAAPPRLLDYATYMIPFHQLAAGPIERYPDAIEKLTAALPPLTFDDTLLALNRIANGLVKKLVLAEMLVQVAGFELQREGMPLWLEVNLLALWVYFDFSGYMDMMIGLGMLAGWKPPENFDWPFLSRNIVEFWTRWHMTLGTWIRDYMFMPLNLWLQRGPLGRNVFMAGAVAYLVSMTFAGMWHRTTLGFAIWGLFQGIGIVVCKGYELFLKRVLSRKNFLANRQSRVTAVAAGFVTFQYVAASFVLAFHPPREALRIYGRMLGVD